MVHLSVRRVVFLQQKAMYHMIYVNVYFLEVPKQFGKSELDELHMDVCSDSDPHLPWLDLCSKTHSRYDTTSIECHECQ